MHLQELERLQVKTGNRYYAPGMFPSQRVHPFLPYRREDSNIFYPALIDFTLSPLLGLMEPDERERTERILGGIRSNYPYYESLRQPGLYNFYRTNPPDPYPNGYFLRHFRHFRLAEDADDTVMISTNLVDLAAEKVDFVRAELVRFSNLEGQKLKHSPEGYGGIPAHGVWFGSGAMPVEIDFCVLCNILYFTARKQGAFNDADLASFEFIRRVILTDDLFEHAFALSYYYPDPTVMLYHAARLWSGLESPEEHLPRAELVAAIQRRLAEDIGLLPKIMLTSSLLKMEQKAPVITYSRETLRASFQAFPFFIAPMLAGTNSRLLNRLAAQRMFQVDYVCEAYYWSLVWEYELLSRKQQAV